MLKPFVGLCWIWILKRDGLLLREKWWARGALNPRPRGYEPRALTRLSYGPRVIGAAGPT